MRVPLLYPVVAVLHPLDPVATRAVDPPGAPTQGYDDILGEPIPYDAASGAATDTRQESAELRIPCQVEVMTHEELQQMDTGDAPLSRYVLVFHRSDLDNLGLLDATTRKVSIKKNDRVSRIEKKGFPGTVTHPLDHDLFVYKIEPGSWGMGPDGYDLELCYLATRPDAMK
jgi:hypothetical protein